MGNALYVKGSFDIPPTPKGKLIMSEKCYAIIKTFYLLGGKATATQVFNAMSMEDKIKFNIQSPIDIRWFVAYKQIYIRKTDEKGEKYMDMFGGKYKKVYQLNQRALNFFNEEMKNAGSE